MVQDTKSLGEGSDGVVGAQATDTITRDTHSGDLDLVTTSLPTRIHNSDSLGSACITNTQSLML